MPGYLSQGEKIHKAILVQVIYVCLGYSVHALPRSVRTAKIHFTFHNVPHDTWTGISRGIASRQVDTPIQN